MQTISMMIAAFSQLTLGGAQSQSTLGVYNTSKTPSSLPWNTYNYCNAPHVNAKHYQTPPEGDKATLVYLNVLMRHHKVSSLTRAHYDDKAI